MSEGYSMQPTGQWIIRIPGQPDSPVDTFTLQSWARAGYLKGTTMVIDANTGQQFPASQIPGVFSDKDFTTVLLLSLFVGTLGVDRFYLGQTGLGVAKLLTLGGCGVWALVDFILIAMRKVTDNNGLPLA